MIPNNKKQPVFLDLTRIRQPVNALLSIAHRITGIVMVLMVPVVAYLFDRSLAGEESFESVAQMLHAPAARAAIVALAWVLCHHLLAGIRYLLIDVDIGVDIHRAQASARLVFVGGVVAALLVAVALL